jgi:hypothetical protein
MAYAAGFSVGSALHRRQQGSTAPLQAVMVPKPQPPHQAIFDAWEEEDAAGRWEEPEPVEPLFGGSMSDLIDPEAGEEEPPLRWAMEEKGIRSPSSRQRFGGGQRSAPVLLSVTAATEASRR